MLGRLAPIAGLAFAGATLFAQDADRPSLAEIRKVEAEGLAVRYVAIPWGPNTFAAMEAPADSFYNRRAWPFARLQTAIPVTIDDARLAPGNYALVFHPNNVKNEGMSLEVVKIDVEEFLEPGNVMVKAPAGQSVHRVPVRFDAAAPSAPALTIGLTPSQGRVTMTVRYGDRVLVKDFRF